MRSSPAREACPTWERWSTSHPVASVYVDAELRYIRVNDEFCRFVGVSKEILGRRIAEGPAGGLDRDMVDRVLTEQVLAGAPLVVAPATSPDDSSTKQRPPARAAHRPVPSSTPAAAPGTLAARRAPGSPEGLAARHQGMAG